MKYYLMALLLGFVLPVKTNAQQFSFLWDNLTAEQRIAVNKEVRTLSDMIRVNAQPAFYLQRARDYILLKEPQKALADVYELRLKGVDDPLIYQISGDAKWLEKDTAGARQDYLNMQHLYPQNPEGYIKLSALYLEEQLFDEAFVLAEEARKQGLADHRPSTVKAVVLIGKGEAEEAEKYREEVELLLKDDGIKAFFLTYYYTVAQDAEKAKNPADRLVALFPTEPEPRKLRAFIYGALEDMPEDTLLTDLRLYGEWVKGDSLMDQYELVVLYELADYDSLFLEKCRMYMERYQDDTPALEQLAEYYDDMEMIEEAIETYTTLIRKKPLTPHFYYTRGFLLYDDGKKKEGCADFRKYLELGGDTDNTLIRSMCP